MRTETISLALVALTACGDPCTAEHLQGALDGASPGDVVTLPGCRIEGAFVVPDGVTLRGASGSELGASAPLDIVVELSDGAALESVAIDGGGRAAVVTRGDATVRDVTIDARRGHGVYADGGTVTLERVSIAGPVTADDAADTRWISVAPSPPAAGPCTTGACECDPGAVDAEMDRICTADGRWATWAGTMGLYARGATLRMTDVTVAGLTEVGVLTDASTVEWDGGGVRDVIGVGVLMRGGSSTLTDLDVERVVAGARGVPSYGVIAADGHAMASDGLTIADGERYGVLVLGASASNVDLTARGNGDVAVWAGDAEGFSITGASTIEGNGFAGVVVSESRRVTLDGLTVEMTALVRRNVGSFGVLELGDGIQLTGVGEDVALSNVTVRGNARVGLLVDVAPSITFSGVTVDASGAAYGALGGARDATRGEIAVTNPAGWDAGITRTGAAAANDATASGGFAAFVSAQPDMVGGATGIIGPMY